MRGTFARRRGLRWDPKFDPDPREGGRRCPLPWFTKRGETRRRKKRDPADAKPMGFTRNRDCAVAAPIILVALQANRREESREELISGEIKRNIRTWLNIIFFEITRRSHLMFVVILT